MPITMTDQDFKRLQKKVDSGLVRQKYPDIADEIRKLVNELPKLRKRVAGAELTAQKAYARILQLEMIVASFKGPVNKGEDNDD